MGWLIALGSVSAYFGLGALLARNFRPWLWEKSLTPGWCFVHSSHRGCVAAWSWGLILAWPGFWPFMAMNRSIEGSDPRILEIQLMERNDRIRELEKEALQFERHLTKMAEERAKRAALTEKGEE